MAKRAAPVTVAVKPAKKAAAAKSAQTKPAAAKKAAAKKPAAPRTTSNAIAIVGAGPTGLIAAEHLAKAGFAVTIYDRMPSPARKFLLAGRGGLNLTHAEPLDTFLGRYGDASEPLKSAIRAYPPETLRGWAAELGEETFIGTSGRVFPKSFKATPLTRAWLRRLDTMGVRFVARHHWTGWDTSGALTFSTPDGTVCVQPAATLLALGGASWPRLGSDGGWAAVLAAHDIAIAPLQASNVGVEIDWSEIFRLRNAGQPLKGCTFTVQGMTSRAEAIVTATGMEGGAIYALSPAIRAALATGNAGLTIDLRPESPEMTLAQRISAARKGETLSNVLRKQAGLSPVALGLLREAGHGALPTDPATLARMIKAVPLTITALRPMARAISTAGGVSFEEIDTGLMLKKLPGVFVAGEMLDWDAPTGGYLLQGCFSTGVAAAAGIAAFVNGAEAKPKRRRKPVVAPDVSST